jgi:carbamoyltransferase
MHLLGINFSGHDSSAGLIRDGEILAAALEERFTRRKHAGEYPFKAIEYCLKEAGIGIRDIDHVVCYWNPGHELGDHVDTRDYVRDNREFLYFFPNQFMYMLPRDQRGVDYIVEEVHFAGKTNPTKFYFVEHHMAHAASCFFVSPFEESAILSVDSYGEKTTALMAYGKGHKIETVDKIEMPHSLGQLYSAVTQYLGFRTNSGEGKIMGLASYGQPAYEEQFRKIVKFLPGGRFELDLAYFEFYLKRPRKYSDKFVELFGPVRQGEHEPITKRHEDIAASLQKITEDLMLHFAGHLKERTKSQNLCLAGGVVLNSVANGKVFKTGMFKEVFIHPAAHDPGTSLGGPLFVYHQLMNQPRKFVQIHDYWGPGYSDEEIEKILHISKLTGKKVENAERFCAEKLAENQIVGWFQGRMEFGPRALGNRSILANPCHPEMKDILNRWVKHREGFRPFAPSILAEKCGEYFDSAYPSPFMLLVYDVLPEKRSVVPAITHVDNTGRVQTVTEEENPRYYRMIREFEKLTGVPIVLNTSFNIRGEPIVCSPQDALKCFFTTGMDYLIMGNWVIDKQQAAGKEACRESAASRIR